MTAKRVFYNTVGPHRFNAQTRLNVTYGPPHSDQAYAGGFWYDAVNHKLCYSPDGIDIVYLCKCGQIRAPYGSSRSGGYAGGIGVNLLLEE